MPIQSPFTIALDASTRQVLEQRARAYTRPYYEVVRAKIVLYAADGMDNAEIARRLDTSPQIVHRWRKRFFERGMAALEDRPRPGRPPGFSPL
ncbi:MAG: helix-turn-helix domain-containing protein [Acidimicrobiales bacterium]